MIVQVGRGVVWPYHFCNLGAKWRWVVSDTLQALNPWKESWYPLYIRLGGPQGLYGWVWKISLTLGLKSMCWDSALKQVKITSFPSVLLYHSQKSYDSCMWHYITSETCKHTNQHLWLNQLAPVGLSLITTFITVNHWQFQKQQLTSAVWQKHWTNSTAWCNSISLAEACLVYNIVKLRIC